MKRRLIIVGASGHGKVVADIAIKMNQWEVIEFLDDNDQIKLALGLPVVGTLKDASKFLDDSDFFVAIGDNETRSGIQTELETLGASLSTLIHPRAIIGSEVSIGIGTVIMAGVVINPCTTIGKGCIINTSASVDHDNIIGDFIHVSPGVNIAGTVKIEKLSWIGIGSVVSNNVSVCSNCMVGAGAVVIRNTTEPGTYIGVPVKRAEE